MGVSISATSFPTGKFFCPLHIKRERISSSEGHPKGYWKGVVHILLSYNTPQQEYSGNLGPWATPDLKSQQPCSWICRSEKVLKMTWHRDFAHQGAAGAEPDTDQSRVHAHHRHESLITWDNLVGTASGHRGSCAQCTFPLSLKSLPLSSRLLISAAFLSLEHMFWSKVVHGSLGLVLFLPLCHSRTQIS